MTHVDQHAVELRGTLFVRNVFQGHKQLFQVLLVGGVRPGIAGGVNPRRTAQKIHGQTGIIGNRGQAGYLRRMARFQNGVFDKRQAGLFGGVHAQLGLSHHVQPKII